MKGQNHFMASTPASTKDFPGDIFGNSISRMSGDGDFGSVPTVIDPKDYIRTPNRQRNLSWKRVKASLSRSQTQLVEIFSRAAKSSSRIHLNLNRNGNGTLDTIFSDEPTLLSAQKTPTTPVDDSQPQTQKKKLVPTNGDTANAHASDVRNLNDNKINPIPMPRKKDPSATYVIEGNSGAHLKRTLSSTAQPTARAKSPPPKVIQAEKKDHTSLLQENKKLKEENEELFEENRILTLTIEDAQTRLRYFQNRNKYLEVAMYQEGKVLSNIIRECHEEIAILKMKQCELLGTPEDNLKLRDVEQRIREYYIGKYEHVDEEMFFTQDGIPSPPSGFPTDFLENLPEGIAE